MTISKRKAEQAVNCGTATIIIPWPADILGAYGVSKDTDAAMDRYVAATIEPDPDVEVIGACAGRTSRLIPVISVTIGRKSRFGVTRGDAVTMRTWVRPDKRYGHPSDSI